MTIEEKFQIMMVRMARLDERVKELERIVEELTSDE
jgi:tetrahydromethanopterin S-methyltransferase subunit B